MNVDFFFYLIFTCYVKNRIKIFKNSFLDSIFLKRRILYRFFLFYIDLVFYFLKKKRKKEICWFFLSIRKEKREYRMVE